MATPLPSDNCTENDHNPPDNVTGLGDMVTVIFDCGMRASAVTLMYWGAAAPERSVTVLVYRSGCLNHEGSTVIRTCAGALCDSVPETRESWIHGASARSLKAACPADLVVKVTVCAAEAVWLATVKSRLVRSGTTAAAGRFSK